MKKILYALFAVTLMFSLCACSQDKENESSSCEISSVNSVISSSSQLKSEAASSENLKDEVSRKAKDALASVVTSSMTEVEKAKIAYDWLFYHFKYRAMTVDLSNGYTDELTLELASYYFKYHKGSCEHYAAAQKVLLEELGFNVKYVEGERYDSKNKIWGEHVWVMMEIDGNWYHVDGLFGGNHTASLSSMFCVPDSALENTHRYNKEDYPACTQPQILK